MIGRSYIKATSTAVANENYYLWEPAVGPRAGRRLVFYHHGTGGETFICEPSVAARANIRPPLYELLNRGYAILSADYGGPATFANDINQGRLDAWLTASAAVGYRTDRIALIGESMGHQCLFKWAQTNPTQVAAIIGWIPGCDLTATYDNQPGFAATMDAAYPSGGWAGNKTTRDPMLMDISTFPAENWRVYYASDDPTYGARPIDCTNLADRLGVPTHAINAGTGGHTDTCMANVEPRAWADFIDAGDWS